MKGIFIIILIKINIYKWGNKVCHYKIELAVE